MSEVDVTSEEETEAEATAPVFVGLVTLASIPVGESFATLSTGRKAKVVSKGFNPALPDKTSYVEVLYEGATVPISIAPGMLVQPLGLIPEGAEVYVSDEARKAEEDKRLKAEAEAAEAEAAKNEAERRAAEAEAEKQEAERRAAEAEAARRAAEAAAEARLLEQARAVEAAKLQTVHVEQPKPVTSHTAAYATVTDLFTDMLQKPGYTIAHFFAAARQHFPELAAAKSLTSCQNQVQVLRSKLRKAGYTVQS